MIVLDTNVVSELMRAAPTSNVERHFALFHDEMVTTVITVYEIRYGILRLPIGVQRTRLDGSLQEFANRLGTKRLLGLDARAAQRAAELRAQREGLGRPMSVQDGLIAGICSVHNATLASRNVKDFEGLGLDVVNPWLFDER